MHTNAIIANLIAQATTVEDTYPAGCNGYPTKLYGFDREKFAALIVKACADAADMAQAARCKDAGDYVAEQMGFGAEEGVSTWRTE
jgi:hypothetical protein